MKVNQRLDLELEKVREELVRQTGPETFAGMIDADIPVTGKLIRPRLLLMTADKFGVIGHDARTLATAVEMIHLASLVHDDVIDEATLRRGRPPLYVQTDAKVAVMSGDILFSKAMNLICTLDVLEVYRRVTDAVVRLASGQLRDWLFTGEVRGSIDEYLRIVDGKTGSLLALCLELPAILADYGAEDLDRLRHCGLLMGRAFQIADDMLDLPAPENHTGKTAFLDLEQGKFAFPYLLLAQEGGPAMTELLRNASKGQDRERQELLEAINQFEIRQRARTMIVRFVDEAVDDLQTMFGGVLPPEVQEMIQAMVFRKG